MTPSAGRGAPTLYVFSGLPASGKTTLARMLAKRMEAAHLRIDTLEQGLRDLCALDVEGEGYGLAYRVAEDNLRLGVSVVADSCNPVAPTRRAWEKVAEDAGAEHVDIEVVCSDRAEHRRRVESRTSSVPGLRLPTWREVERREYHPWTDPRVVIDTAGRSATECAEELISRLEPVAAPDPLNSGDLLRLNVIKADPVLRLIAAQKGFEDGSFGFLDGWTIFKIFMKLPAVVRDEGGTFQAHPAEGDPDVLEVFMGRQLSEVGEMGFRDTRAVGLHFVFQPSGKSAATHDPREGPEDLEDSEDEQELWSADFETLEEFFSAVEESDGFRTACTRALVAVSFHSQEEV